MRLIWNGTPGDREMEKYLRRAGFELFSSDGTYFVDSRGNKYGAWTDLAETQRKVKVEGGEKHYIVVRGVRDVKPEEDVFQLLYEVSATAIFPTQEVVMFLEKSPCPTHYNAAIVSPLAKWAESGFDGSSEKTLYSVLMLKSRVERREEFRRDETEQEGMMREIEESEEPY